MYQVCVRHWFEAAHRLSARRSPLKCQSIHGHSWRVSVCIEGSTLDDRGMVVEFGSFKQGWNDFLMRSVDHHLILKTGDPYADAIRSVDRDARILELPDEPTTENLARWLCERAEEHLSAILPSNQNAQVKSVTLRETDVNSVVVHA